jgi:NAD(P)H-dependent FMN reductase
MKRLLLNGSPRGKTANSRRILGWIAEGMAKAGEKEEAPILDLAFLKELNAQKKAFLEADEVVLAFPLYTDAMPGIVKNFFESLAEADLKALSGKRIALVVQSGFSESIHSEAVVAYFERLFRRLGMVHLGSIVKGGAEGLQMMPDQAAGKLKACFVRAGSELVSSGRISEDLIGSMAKPRLFGPIQLLFIRLGSLTGLANFYWDIMLRKHKAYDKRFDAPFGRRATAR